MTASIIPFEKEKYDPKCSFCKKPKSKVKKMVDSHKGYFICDECIKKCKELTKESIK
jgi:transposase-like protein